MSSEQNDTPTRILDATWRLMEQGRGKVVKMGDVAKAAGISRQAVYLHFKSRTALMIATSHYVDDIKGLKNRLKELEQASDSVNLLEICIEVWGNYIPEIFGLAKALLATRENDEATATVWQNNMASVKAVCQNVIEKLDQENRLADKWSIEEATDIFYTMISINNWEQFTAECGWSNEQYIERMKIILNQTLVKPSASIET